MSSSFVTPLSVQLLQALASGLVQRDGSVLKDVLSGQILGHLKEVGTWAQLATHLPIDNPACAPLELARWADTHCQLQAIGQTLTHLQLLSSVGAAASVVGLGTSVAGFGLVLSRLERLERNVHSSLATLQAEVERLHLKTDLLHLAELHAAAEQLDGARHHPDQPRSRELLRAAEATFQKYRHYYHLLLRELRPQEYAKLPLATVRQLLGRLQSSAQAELEANLLLGDLQQWRFRHEKIAAQMAEVCHCDAKTAVRVRAEGLLTEGELKRLCDEALMTRDFCAESVARARTAESEIRWLEREQISPAEYFHAFAQAPDVGVVLVPQS